jgi:oligosaccharyl transferase (archaeosortase A-associated)
MTAFSSSEVKRWLSARYSYGLMLLLIFAIALSLRVLLPYDSVFGGGWVRFAENDPWYHMRLVENLLEHFPHRISFDPYTFFPRGQAVYFAPFFDLLLGFTLWVIGLGSPSQHMIETVGAYFPAILGALVTIPVYFIGKELFNRNAGLLSAALVAILPGEFLTRSLLGFTDHHVAEVLFSSIVILFLILALKRAQEKGISFSHFRGKGWRDLRKPLLYALLAGIALGVYLLTWVGGPLLVFILFGYAVLQYLIDHLRGKSTDYLCIVGVPVFLIALVIIVPLLNQLASNKLYLLSLVVALLAFPVLSGLSRLMERGNIRRAYYPLALAGLGLVSLGGLRIIDPSLFHSMMGKFSMLHPHTGALTITEVRPLFWASGGFSLAPAWDRFTTSLVLAPIALGLITYAAVKKVSAEKVLFLVWSGVMIVATLVQVRFTYYLAVNVALLSGYLCWRVPGWISSILGRLGFREPAETEGGKVEKRQKEKLTKGKKLRAKEKRQQPKGVTLRYLKPKYVTGTLSIIAVFFLAFYPNIGRATSKGMVFPGPSEDWHSALVWMRENTPDPFQNPDFYYELYERPARGESYNYPSSAYGVMSWWDYGHWITAIAHRIPNANPFQAGVGSAAHFFTAQDVSSASTILDRLGSKYVIIDQDMARVDRKFPAMAIWAGEDVSQFFEIYYQRTPEGKLQAVPVYYPEYYQTMCSRLYVFGGEQWEPLNSTWVLSYTEMDGHKVISDVANNGKPFITYQDAQAFLETHPDYIIVGLNPLVSPVPLEKLEHYQLVYHSDSPAARQGDKIIYQVEIFEYSP